MISAPKFLPYRVRRAVDQVRINSALRGLERTAPCQAAARADVELHMLLCRRDLRMGVLAAKSLLRFTEQTLALALTDDGTLRAADRAWVDRHIPGARWLTWPASDPELKPGLAAYPHLAALYGRPYPPVCKLVHPMLLARAKRVVVLDPDTAFFNRPHRLLSWVREGGGPCYLHDHQDEAVAVPQSVKQTFADLERAMALPGRSWCLPHRLFNSGLLAYERRDLSLATGEKYLAWWQGLPATQREGKAAIWFGPWTPEQTCYHVMFALAARPALPLGHDYHLGGEGGHVFNHFLRHYLVQSQTLRRLQTLTLEL